ncbi:hypothetical protein [Pelomicrobium sp. G1]|uniref:hypothetical protein n=1 Tax=unclassified Pelomicrobium TaxID=2815318 RepID=UPI0021DD753C|nr:MAG: hypothetical protein KatS3mg123_2014 [Burkholderiales bacterium]
MPEQISKYPEVTIQVLQSAGARCGPGVEKNILTRCPSERFCALPGGEICVYGLDQIPHMTQITREELARVACPPRSLSGVGLESALLPEAGALGAAFALGMVVGALSRRRRKP